MDAAAVTSRSVDSNIFLKEVNSILFIEMDGMVLRWIYFRLCQHFWWGYEKEIGLSIPTFFGGVELKMFGWGGKMFGKEPKKKW